jgi:hypothetical protein
MSCLYSSPEVIGVEVTNLEVANRGLPPSCHSAWSFKCHDCSARLTRTESRVQFHTDVATRRRQQRRVPHSPAYAGCINSFCLPKQAQLSCVSLQAQYQAFVRFAVGSSAALSAIALDWTCVLEPFTRGGLSL